MKFHLVLIGSHIPSEGINAAYLKVDRWNDNFKFVTMFYLSLHDQEGNYHEIGNIKIGYKGQDETPTYKKLDNIFEKLSDTYFSLGQDVDYYQNIAKLPEDFKLQILTSLNDVVYNPNYFDLGKDEDVFSVSLLRDISFSSVKGQFKRILEGLAPLTDFHFMYKRPEINSVSSIELEFLVKQSSKPSTNIHALIGRNGVGKTTLLNGMIEAIINREQFEATFHNCRRFYNNQPIDADYFSRLVSVSFSAFDPFTPPKDQSDPLKGTCYFYIGLQSNEEKLKSLDELHDEFNSALKLCLSQPSKKSRWIKAIETLESDENFAEMNLKKLSNNTKEQNQKLISRMSSGHSIVLLTITRLIATVEEKTLVLLDEPESHLHPPLLSAFIRALSELLYDRNGVAIIATHSPVVLQEIPKSCVWIITRIGALAECRRPEIETFGENVGVLTREVFGLEVSRSGFYFLLAESVKEGGTYEEILNKYGEQLGFEARNILKLLLIHRDKETNSDSTR